MFIFEKKLTMSSENINLNFPNSFNSKNNKNSENGNNKRNSHRNSRRFLPYSENELLAVAKVVCQNWNEEVLKLKWITKDEFVSTVNEFEKQITNIEKFHKDRKRVVFELSELDDEINLKISRLKHNILASFSRNVAKSIIAQVGLNGRLNKKNREDKVILLQTLPEKLKDLDLNLSDDLGIEAWQTIFQKYSDLLLELKGIVSVDSEYIASKNANKEKIYKTLNSLVYAVKANFPDTWRSELRPLGLQREFY